MRFKIDYSAIKAPHIFNLAFEHLALSFLHCKLGHVGLSNCVNQNKHIAKTLCVRIIRVKSCITRAVNDNLIV